MRTIVTAFLAILASVPAALSQSDHAGAHDFPGISRMPGYYINFEKDSVFDAFSFPVTVNKRDGKQSVEGHYYQIDYKRLAGGEPISGLQIKRNYQNAAVAMGGKMLFDDGPTGSDTTFMLPKPDAEIWVLVHIASTGPTEYYLNIVEKRAMRQEVTMDAQARAGSIQQTGAVAIYGIHFDTGRAEFKPESAPALDEIVKMLTASPNLRIYVVGHTDEVGDAAMNLKLSQARAQAVIAELTGKRGIAAARLVPFGCGPYAPVADNRTEEGRAKNRRVELVEIATQ